MHMKQLYTILITAFLLALPIQNHAQTQITFYTTMGDFVVEMTDSLTPITSGNFISLTMQEFYDGVIFHRVIDDFVIQGGDPTGTGYGGPGYSIPDEFDSTLSNIQGTISMANSGPNTGGSQFFFNLVDNTYLDFDKPPFTSKHPVFGWVVSGWQVVEDISEVPVDGNNKPLTDVVMDSLRISYWNPLSVEEKENTIHHLNVYPNPANESSTLSFYATEPGSARIVLFDNTGKMIEDKGFDFHFGSNSISLASMNIAHLPSGIYIIELQHEETTQQLKLLR